MIERWTERQLIIALAWINLQWNRPDRHDHYQMQTAAMMSAKKDAKLDDFKLKFEEPNANPLSLEEEQFWAEARWAQRLGGR